MSEKRRGVHPEEPAEGGEEDVEECGAEKAGGSGTVEGPDAETRSLEHPEEPAEGGEEDTEAPDAGRSGSGG